MQFVAKTGWTTTNLINAIEKENITDNFDLVTLLIGVNNQIQNSIFSIYEKESPEVISTCIKAANNKRKNVFIVSIPDDAFSLLQEEIHQYPQKLLSTMSLKKLL